MRTLACLFCLVALGCGAEHRAAAPPPEAAAAPAPEPAPAPATPDEKLPPDLRTRRTGSDWPGFLGPAGTGVSTEKGILAPWPKDGLRIVWTRDIGLGYAAPSVSRGRLFLFDRVGNRARLRCLKSETGEPLWTFDYPSHYVDDFGYEGGPRCCPVIDGNRVYIYGAEGMLHCVRVSDGKPLWKVDTVAEFGVVKNFFGVGSTPAVEGDKLLVVVGGSPRPRDDDPPAFDELKGNKSGLVAFDKYTGKVRYRVTDELAGYASPVLATIGGRRWCFVFARGGLVGLDPASGKVDFHFPWRAKILASVNASNPVVVGNRVFISETYGPGGALLEVKPGGYRVVWTDARKRDKSMQCHWNTPIHVGGYLYGCSGRHPENAELRCIELATGKVMWRKPELTRTSLLLVDGYFVCLGEDGVLRLLKVDPRKYEEVSSLEVRPLGEDGKPDARAKPLLQKDCWAAPVLSHGLLYVRGTGRLVCLELIPARGKNR